MTVVNKTLKWRPRVKGRPRFRRAGEAIVTYTPPETLNAELDLREQWTDEPLEGPLSVHVVLSDEYVTVDVQTTEPHASKKLRGDIDNYAKLVLDGLNGVAWLDDKQIVDLRVVKL
jgi:Holliday junction resolvase RusA-like endonuclease